MARRKDKAHAARAQRRARGQALADLAAGSLVATEVVREPPDALGSVDLYDVLRKCPGLGRESVRRICERAAVWPHTPMSELTEAQRSAIVLALPARLQQQA